MKNLLLILVIAVAASAATEVAVIQLKGGGTGTFFLSSVNGVLSWVSPPTGAPVFQLNITPAGTINGTNVTFTLPTMPSATPSIMLYRNGILQQQSSTGDYTFAGSTITFNSASVPQTNDILLAFYF